MFWVFVIVQAFALEPYFGPRGLLWLGLNPQDDKYNSHIPSVLVHPQSGQAYLYQNGLKKGGYIRMILEVGSNGIVGIIWEED